MSSFLVAKIIEGYYSDGPSLAMDKKLLPIVEKAISKFAYKFPRIEGMSLDSFCQRCLSRQISTTLVGVFADKLFVLHSAHLYGESLAHSLYSLTSLTYEFNQSSRLFLSKMDTQSLEKLHISSKPTEFSWGFFQKLWAYGS